MSFLIEDFNQMGPDDLVSFPGEDVDIDQWEISNGTLHLYGNTWKIQYLNDSIRLKTNTGKTGYKSSYTTWR